MLPCTKRISRNIRCPSSIDNYKKTKKSAEKLRTFCRKSFTSRGVFGIILLVVLQTNLHKEANMRKFEYYMFIVDT